MASPPAVPPLSQKMDVTITDGTSISSGFSLRGRVPTAILIPASWTAANITFQACSTVDGTYVDVYGSDGNELAYTAAASSRAVVVDPVEFYGFNFLKIRSGTTGTPVNQSGDITLELMLGRPTT